MKLTDGSHSYIIRIYRYADVQSRKIIGTAEKVGDKGKQGFTDMDELWEILNARRRGEGQRKSAKVRSHGGGKSESKVG